MLDIKKIIDDRDNVQEALKKRMKNPDLDLIIDLYENSKSKKQLLDSLREKQNKLVNQIKINKEDYLIQESKKNKLNIKGVEEQFNEVNNKYREKLGALPNIPAEDVPAGGKENNEVLRTYGNKPEFKFKNKDHVELATSLDLIDYERATKMSGAGFWAYKNEGALLEWALLNYFKDFHQKNKYTFLLLPYLLNQESAYASGHLPKFKEDLFWTDEDKLCLNATSEMMLLNYHRQEILEAKDLPLKYYAFSTCFRKEAGAYRTEERGMIRGHQFNKIEMFQFTKSEESWSVFEEMVKNVEELVKGLGLHFQTVKLAAQDASAAMAKTIDIEVWLPSMNCYKEVSSASNALDYQARRANIRFKDQEGKSEFVYTLNASGLATSRILPAILEQNQQADGSVQIPRVLRKYLSFKVIKPRT
jgi:seryl-tRNA synthetase